MKEADLEEQMRALADPVRMRIVRLLALPVRSRTAPGEAGFCACDIEAVMGVGQSTVSHHMKQLMRAGLVDSTKTGRWVYYRIRQEAFAELSAALARFAGDPAACTAAGPDQADGMDLEPGCCGPQEPPAAPAPAPARKLAVIARRKSA
jgi:ArsR family transcriptional regulator